MTSWLARCPSIHSATHCRALRSSSRNGTTLPPSCRAPSICRRATFPPTSRTGQSEVVRAKVLLAHELCAPLRSGILWPHHATPLRCRSTSGCGSRRGWTGSTSMRLTRQGLRCRHSCQQGPETQSDAASRGVYGDAECCRGGKYWHEDVTVPDSDGGAAKIHEVLGVYRHREKFTIDAFHLPASIAALVAEWGLDAVRSFVVPLWTAFHGALPSPAEARQSISSLHSPRGSFVCRTACGMNSFHCRLMNLPFNLLTQPTNHRSTIGFYTDLARVFHWRKFPFSLMSWRCRWVEGALIFYGIQNSY